MPPMELPKLLIVAGDYDVALNAKRGIEPLKFEVQMAFSHRDALAAVAGEAFAAVLVDAAMFDRRTREATIIALARGSDTPPLIGYVTDALSDINARRANAAIITTFDVDTLHPKLAPFAARQIPAPTVTTATLRAVSEANPTAPVRERPEWRDEEIQTLLALSRSLTEVLDLSEVLNRVVEAARRLTDADEGMILMPDGDANELYLRARVGIDLETARNFRVKTGDTLAGEVFDRGQPVLIGASGPLKVKTEYFVNSLLYVPIFLKGTVIGVLGVNNKTKHDLFDLRHQELLLNLAAYAAIAIENARVHEQSVRRNRELKALVDASLVINETLSLDVLLPTICDQLLRVINVQHAEVFQWRAEKRQLVALARAYRRGFGAGIDMALTVDERLIVRSVLESGRHAVVELEHGARLLLPIVGGNQVYGMVRAAFGTSVQAQQGADMAGRAGLAALELLGSLSAGIVERHYRQAEELAHLLGASALELGMMGQGGKLKLLLSVGKEAFNGRHPALNLSDYPELVEAMESDAPIIQRIGQGQSTPGGRALMELSECRSLLAISMCHRGERQGMVVFGERSEQRAFSSRDIELARALVGQASMALANARLLLDLETSLCDLRETQTRLIQTERLSAMGELATAVAHQINNPVTTIVYDAQLLLERTDLDEELHDSLSAILRAGKRAGTVVRRLLSSARTDKGAAPPEAIDIMRTIDDTVALVRSYVERERIRLRVMPPAVPLPPVFLAPGELDDVWLNLLMNAHDALVGRDNPEIRIQVEWEPGASTVGVVVWDNGPGVPEAIRHEIFKPFFTTKKAGEGTGVGLHICRQVVERAGGTIELESWMDAGTRFMVRLPVGQEVMT